MLQIVWYIGFSLAQLMDFCLIQIDNDYDRSQSSLYTPEFICESFLNYFHRNRIFKYILTISLPSPHDT